nr:copia protein [Tanacetum cinerariifolium]
MKGIKREFSVARTPQQNGVAERKNRTLIEAARTMLADSKLPPIFRLKQLIPLAIKAFRVFNSRTKIVKKNMHVKFSENTPNIAGSGPNWLFDINALTKSINYKQIVTRNQSNGSAGTKACDNVGKTSVETVLDKDYILLPLWTQDPLFSSSSKDSLGVGFKPSGDEEKKDAKDPRNEDSEIPITKEPRVNQKKDSVNSTNKVNAISLTVNAASNEVNAVGRKLSIELSDDLNMPELEDISIFEDSNKDVFGLKWVFRNKLDERGIMIRNKARLVAQGHTLEEGIDYDEVFTSFARIETIRLFLAYASFKDYVVYQMDVKSDFRYGKIEEEVYVCQPPGFKDLDLSNKIYKVEKALYGLHQAPRAWYETLSTYLLDNGFLKGMIDKTLFIKRDKSDILLVQVYVDDIIFESTRKEMCTKFEKMMHKKFQICSMGELIFFLGLQVKQKEDGIFISQDKYVNEILNKFGYSDVKTTSTPMETHKTLLKDEKREDYSLTMNPTIYTSCIKQFWATAMTKNINREAQIHAKVDGKKVVISEATIRRDLKFKDEGGVDCLSNEVIFKQLTLMGTMASGIICLATNQKFNLFKYIFESMVKHLDTKNKFLMYPRFVQVILDNHVFGMSKHNAIYVIPSHTKKVFGNMKRVGKDFSRKEKPLFPTMLVQAQADTGEAVVVKEVDAAQDQVSAATITVAKDLTVDDITLAKSLEAFKTSKPKIRGIVVKDHKEPSVTTTTPTSIDDSTRPKEKGIVMQEPIEVTTTTILIPSQVKDKRKGKMVEPEMPLKKKAQIILDEELTFKL